VKEKKRVWKGYCEKLLAFQQTIGGTVAILATNLYQKFKILNADNIFVMTASYSQLSLFVQEKSLTDQNGVLQKVDIPFLFMIAANLV